METKISQISELSNLLANEDSLNVNLIRLFNRFGLGRLMKQLCIKKERGASAGDLILLLCLFRIPCSLSAMDNNPAGICFLQPTAN